MFREMAQDLRVGVDEVAQDLRVGLRGLLRAPMLTLTIVATVGLGIGATTVILSAVNATLLRPLPYANADRLVRICTDTPPNKFPFSILDYLALEGQQTPGLREAVLSERGRRRQATQRGWVHEMSMDDRHRCRQQREVRRVGQAG
jgi:hypothetical protein